MNKHETMFEALEKAVGKLRDIEFEQNDEDRRMRIFKVRRSLQIAQNEYLKQGDRVLITKKFELRCCECNEKQSTEDEYYLHLRQKHNYPDEDASVQTTNPRHGYDTGLQELRNLLSEYTDTLLEETTNV